MSEGFLELDFTLSKYGKRPVEYLRDLGFLGKNVLAAHSAFLSDGEVEALAEAG